MFQLHVHFHSASPPEAASEDVSAQKIGDGQLLKGLMELLKFLREIGVLSDEQSTKIAAKVMGS